MWKFWFHSLVKEYGWQFLRQVALPHPLRTVKAVLGVRAMDFTADMLTIPNKALDRNLEGARSIVGVGFCLKPMNPPCPSGRPNHDCLYLEHLLHSGASDTPACCQQCAIRKIGIMTLKTGATFYIMTSAKEILLDVFAPALDEARFSLGLFVLCRYSLKPFAVGLLASGIRAWLFSLASGDCRDYHTWLQADHGQKEEQTEICEPNQQAIREILAHAQKATTPSAQFKRQGNVLYPFHNDQPFAVSDQSDCVEVSPCAFHQKHYALSRATACPPVETGHLSIPLVAKIPLR